MAREERIFARVGDAELKLDVFRPASPSVRTAVIMLPGGGWQVGDRSMLYSIAEHMAKKGFTAMPTQYRLTGVAPWPAQRDDVLTAIDWVRNNAAELDIDPERIVLIGYSAGAHLSLITAREAKAAAVVAFFSPSRLSFTPTGTDLDASMLLGPNGDPTVAEEASPIAQLGAGFPPTCSIRRGPSTAASSPRSLTPFAPA
jgi:acetyl esterase/lipase